MNGVTRGDWESKCQLGVGGSGAIVYLVEHTQTHERMAMKQIFLNLEDEQRALVVRELKLLHMAGDCPQIVRFCGAYRFDKYCNICMEYMDLNSVDKLLVHLGPLDEPAIRYITHEVLAAICFLKERKIMHRDVKPSNVLLNSAGQVKLCDLGISVELQKSVAKSSCGTALYLAPERITSTVYDVRADIWSLGVMIVELAEGACPYIRMLGKLANTFTTVQQIVEGPVPTAPAEYSGELRDFAAQCLRKTVVERPFPHELREHAFMRAHEDSHFSMRTWMQERLSDYLSFRVAAGAAGAGATAEAAEASAYPAPPALIPAAEAANAEAPAAPLTPVMSDARGAE